MGVTGAAFFAMWHSRSVVGQEVMGVVGSAVLGVAGSPSGAVTTDESDDESTDESTGMQPLTGMADGRWSCEAFRMEDDWELFPLAVDFTAADADPDFRADAEKTDAKAGILLWLSFLTILVSSSVLVSVHSTR